MLSSSPKSHSSDFDEYNAEVIYPSSPLALLGIRRTLVSFPHSVIDHVANFLNTDNS